LADFYLTEHVVFKTNCQIDMILRVFFPAAALEVGVNRNRFAFGKQKHLIDKVGAPFVEPAAAEFPGQSPVDILSHGFSSHSSELPDVRMDHEYLSKGSLLQDLPHCQEVIIPSSVLVYEELHAAPLRDGNHFIGFFRVERHGFFNNDMLALPERLDRVVLVEDARHGNNNKFYVLIME